MTLAEVEALPREMLAPGHRGPGIMELKDILEKHAKWLNGDSDGEMADLREAWLPGTNLSGANLSSANLRKADLSRSKLFTANLLKANLSNANLKMADLGFSKLFQADLHGADLSGADLRSADLSMSNLSHANLISAKLSSADLSGADLHGTDLRAAVLCGADLFKADLSGADLRSANLYGADLRGANTDGIVYDAKTFFFAMQCPEEGAYIGYKRAGNLIVKLEIPADAKRSSATSRACRASKAKVISITDLCGNPACQSVPSDYDSDFIYTVGKTVEVLDFCEDRWAECASGIHHIITRQEAVSCK